MRPPLLHGAALLGLDPYAGLCMLVTLPHPWLLRVPVSLFGIMQHPLPYWKYMLG